jgi:endonuclease/exonuclease/phosphatase family metal-dependent hydrolase
MATIQELRALALQIRDADEDRENTALKVGQFLYDLLGYLDTKADLTMKSQWSKQLSFNQAPIVALQSVEAIPDTQGQNNKMWWSSDDGQLKWKANDEVYPLGNPTYILYYCGNKIYRWSGSTTGFTEMEASGGASSITAFASYVVKNSTSELPSTGNANTGYIVGTHIYAYVGSHGDTADGKYQDLGGVVSVIPTIDPVTKNWIIGGVLTDRPSRGEKGNDAPVPYIGENGNWYINGNDTGVHAQGDTGNTQILDPTTFDPVTQIVNNLHQGGEGDALSAEMGKRLGDAVFDGAVEEIDVAAEELTNTFIDNNKWAVNNNSSYQGKFFNITQYRGWTFRIGNYLREYNNGGASRWWYRFALLKSGDHTKGSGVQYSDTEPYNGLISVSVVASENPDKQWHEGVIPNDVTHIYVFTRNATETTCPTDFPPDLLFINPNPTNRVERLENVTEGVEDIKADWFAVSGENQQYQVSPTDCWPNQTIGTNGITFYGQEAAPDGRCYPKSASISNVNASPSDCWKVADLPGKILSLKFAALDTNWWAFAVAVFDSSLTLLSRTSPFIIVKATDNWEKTVDLSSIAGAAYFKLIIEQRNSSGTLNGGSYTPNAGFLSFAVATTSRESIPNRVATLEAAVANAAKNTIRVFSYNIGHFAMGRASSPTISDQIPDGDETTPHANYAVQLARWKSKIQNVGADVMAFVEYSTTFGTMDGSAVPTASCGILDGFPYLSVGTTTSTQYMINALISKYPLIVAEKVDLGSPSGVTSKAFMQVATVNVNGIAVKIAATHLNWNQTQDYHDSRILEMKNIIKYFKDDEHVIVCGDFNTEGEYGLHQAGDTDYTMDADEFDIFLYGFEDGGVTYAGGYTAANHGVIGNLLTYPSTGGKPERSPVPIRPLDNVLTKGFRMSNIVVVDDGNLTDHCGIMCDLTLL